MQRALEILVVGRRVGRHLAGQRLGLGIDEQPPRAVEEPAGAGDALGRPVDAVLERPHEQLVHPHRVGTVLRTHVVGVDDVLLALGHLVGLDLDREVRPLDDPAAIARLDLVGVVVLVRDRIAERRLVDHALVEQPLERLLGRHQAGVVEHLVPEPRVHPELPRENTAQSIPTT
ncbi:MAG: hypothetical protein NT062_01360 [Proteobacteria bacterium]|nr:hypothetical protein [Pseudomonadota bacterium]